MRIFHNNIGGAIKLHTLNEYLNIQLQVNIHNYSTFLNNTAMSGAAIHADINGKQKLKTIVSINKSTFTANKAFKYGGAIFVRVLQIIQNHVLKIDQCEFTKIQPNGALLYV